MAEHTPTPWRVERDTDLVWGACDPNDHSSYGMGYPVVEGKPAGWTRQKPDMDEREANAAFIVKAVNSHDALVKALEDLLGSSQAVHQWLTNWDVPFADDDEWAGDKTLFAEARSEAARVLGLVGNAVGSGS